jgi:lipopolysaccharide export LptBFGC system permease protein LptF
MIALLLCLALATLVGIAILLPDVYSYSWQDGPDRVHRCVVESSTWRLFVLPLASPILAFAAFAIGAPRPRSGWLRLPLALFPAAAVFALVIWIEIVSTASDFCGD